jgi:hypothetical protein
MFMLGSAAGTVLAGGGSVGGYALSPATLGTSAAVGTGSAILAGALAAKTAHSAILVYRSIQGALQSPDARDGGGGSGGSTQRPRREPKNGWTNKLARQKAKVLGFKDATNPPFNSRNQPVFKLGNKWITPDVDGHSGVRTWKMFSTSGTRLGTYNFDLTIRIGD